MKLSSKGTEKWGQAVSQIEQSGSSEQQKIVNHIRKAKYNEIIKEQINGHESMRKQMIFTKERERQKINDLCLEEKHNQMNKKMNRKRAEKFYQIENQSLMDLRSQEKKRRQEKKVRNDQFINEILEQNDRRESETRKNFQLLQCINDKQMEMRRNNVKKVAEQSIHDMEMFNSFIENQFKQKNRDRQLWKNKYIRNGSGRYGSSEVDDKIAYSIFLEKQIKQKKSHEKQCNEQIDDKLKPFNQHLQHQGSSPAYLGRITSSFDRQLQLSIIDKHLKMKDLPIEKNYTSATQRKTNSTVQLSHKGDSSFSKREETQPKTTKLQNESSQSIRQRREFTGFDFITGTKKTFFL